MKGKIGSATQLVTPSNYKRHGITDGLDWIERLESIDFSNIANTRKLLEQVLRRVEEHYTINIRCKQGRGAWYSPAGVKRNMERKFYDVVPSSINSKSNGKLFTYFKSYLNSEEFEHIAQAIASKLNEIVRQLK